MATMQPVTPLRLRQRQNYLNALLAVEERARRQNWDEWEAFHAGMMCSMGGLAESNFHNWGNYDDQESQRLADKRPAVLGGGRYIGSDHDSLGTLQQRDSWGTTEERMTPRHAAHAFMDRATVLGVDRRNGIPTREDIQRVQVSFDWTGWNYGVQRLRAQFLMRRYWDKKNKCIKGKRQHKVAANWSFPK